MAELTDREQWEQKVFSKFAERSGLKISAITSCKPPLPDIRCDLDGSEYFFELAEIVPEEQARALSTKGVFSRGYPDHEEQGPKAMIRIIKQKQEKSYETGSAPVDLLLYFSKDLPMYLPDNKPEGAEPTTIDRAAQECQRHGPFSRIWTYDTWNDNAKLLAE